MLHAIAFSTWKRASQNLKSIYQFRMDSVFNQTPRTLVFVQNLRYEIETVLDSKDLYQTLKLRNQISKSPFDLRFSMPGFLYTDKYDSHADHILIRDKKTNSIVGGFRILTSDHDTAYSSEEFFDLTALKKNHTGIMELSRLFLLSEHKHPDLLNLAAHFLSQYSLNAQAQIIISNQSIHYGSSRVAALTARYFSYLGLREQSDLCLVKTAHQVPNFSHWLNHFKETLSVNEMDECLSLLPSVFQESLRLGAKVSGTPALDRSTNCIDFLTILHKEDLNRALWKKSSSHFESLQKFSLS